MATCSRKIDEITTNPEIVPVEVGTAWQGAAKAFQGQQGNTWVLLLVAVLVVYIVLGVLYESYIHPLTILSGLPSAGFGALATLYLFHMELNIYAFVGMIMLIGIVEKNAIMQIDFALDAERNQGLAPIRAIYQGCLIRFRPIMMTTMAALFGAVPIAMGYGAGGEARQPLGLAGRRRPDVLAVGHALPDPGLLSPTWRPCKPGLAGPGCEIARSSPRRNGRLAPSPSPPPNRNRV